MRATHLLVGLLVSEVDMFTWSSDWSRGLKFEGL